MAKNSSAKAALLLDDAQVVNEMVEEATKACPMTVLKDCDMFAPTPSENGGWLLKVRMVQNPSNRRLKFPGMVTVRDVQYTIHTGVRYTKEAFGRAHIVKPLVDLCYKYELAACPTVMDLDGEACVMIYVHGGNYDGVKLKFEQGMDVVDVMFC